MAIGWVVFALVFGSAMLAMALRAVVPEHHLSAESRDDEASAETLLKAELLPPQHKPAHVKIRQQW